MSSASRYVKSPPDAVFAAITDLSRLPDWNDRMTGVVELPPRLTVGAEWVVGFKIMGSSFNSRSVVVDYDPAGRRFVHRSKPDDDNPSATVWTWTVVPEGRGARVTLSWDIQPRTPLRRVAAWIRSRQIPCTDAPASLAALASLCERQEVADA